MATERENIALIQKSLADIKQLERAEIKRAQEAGDAASMRAWNKAYIATQQHHDRLTDLLYENFPGFADEVVIMGPGGR